MAPNTTLSSAMLGRTASSASQAIRRSQPMAIPPTPPPPTAEAVPLPPGDPGHRDRRQSHKTSPERRRGASPINASKMVLFPSGLLAEE